MSGKQTMESITAAKASLLSQIATLILHATSRDTLPKKLQGPELLSTIGLSIVKPGKSRMLCLSMLQCLTGPALAKCGIESTDIQTVICMIKSISMPECIEHRNTTISYLRKVIQDLQGK